MFVDWMEYVSLDGYDIREFKIIYKEVIKK